MASTYSPHDLVFFLGGYDLEMVTIRQLLEQEAPGRFFDKRLGWGACASQYREELIQTLARRRIPVLVELTDDLELTAEKILVADHHGPRSGKDKPTSLHQVFGLLGLGPERWSRWHELVAANDRGYIPALLQAGAGSEEIAKIRAADRAAQGITAQEEQAGKAALVQAKRLADGQVTLVELPHSRTAVVTDFMHSALGGPGYDNLLVICPQEIDFFGAGAVVYALDRAFPGGWYGGGLPEVGFWGHRTPPPEPEAVIAEIRTCLARHREALGGT